MKFFEAQKRAAFATKLFATVGFDFEAALKASDENALKTAFDAQTTKATTELAAANAEIQKEIDELAVDYTKLEGDLKTAKDSLASETNLLNGAIAKIKAHEDLFAAVGFKPGAGTAEDFKKAAADHVAKATTLALAKTGHPPAHVPAATEPTKAEQTDADLKAEYEKLTGSARLDFYNKHERALWRAYRGAAAA